MGVGQSHNLEVVERIGILDLEAGYTAADFERIAADSEVGVGCTIAGTGYMGVGCCMDYCCMSY